MKRDMNPFCVLQYTGRCFAKGFNTKKQMRGAMEGPVETHFGVMYRNEVPRTSVNSRTNKNSRKDTFTLQKMTNT